jgi:hypothetical protein
VARRQFHAILLGGIVKKTFVETRVFTARLKPRLNDDAYRALQNELMANPEKGASMPGCAGLRKVRVADPSRGKGKRGGARVIYLNIPEAERIDLITIYGKDEKDDLHENEKKVLRKLVAELRTEAIAAFRRKGR